MEAPFVDPKSFRRFKRGAAQLHEAGKVGEARRKIRGSKIAAPELVRAVELIDEWLAQQPQHVREYALAKPQPERSTTRSQLVMRLLRVHRRGPRRQSRDSRSKPQSTE